MNPKPILFIDRDGTIVSETDDEKVDKIEKVHFLKDVLYFLRRIQKESDFLLVMVSNQDGLGSNEFPESEFYPVHNFIMRTLETQGILFDKIHIDEHWEKDRHPNRKPGVGMLMEYLKGSYDIRNSYVIGDRLTDVELAKNLGSKAIHISDVVTTDAELTTKSWSEIYEFLIKKSRKAHINRETNETKINIEINLDGSGKSTISTGLSFFDHMLDQLSRHGGVDLEVNVAGDLDVDEHHTMEDTAIALGEAFNNALGNKRGINRYGFLLPMDDALSQVAIDFGGRSWLEWDVEFKREKIGDCPCEMFFHFFKSFCDGAKCNLNVQSEGKNEHHKIESIFKAFAKAIKMAISRSDNLENLPTTKGVI